jgi:RNA polymerase sigma-70 factor (ECF subfamily)
MDRYSPESARLVGLLDRVARNDHAAFAELYSLTSPYLHGIALRVLGKREAAEDVLQEAFINIWQRAGGYAAPLSSPMTWLIVIVRNKALDRLRQTARDGDQPEPAARPATDQAQPDSEPAGPEAMLDAARQRWVLNRAMALLEARHRQSLALTYYAGLSRSELADHLQVPLGTAKAWVRRGLDAMKKCLAETAPGAMAPRSGSDGTLHGCTS